MPFCISLLRSTLAWPFSFGKAAFSRTTPVAPPKTSGHSAEGALNCRTAVWGSLQSMFETNDMGPSRSGETGGLFELKIAFRVNATSSQDMGVPSDQTAFGSIRYLTVKGLCVRSPLLRLGNSLIRGELVNRPSVVSWVARGMTNWTTDQ